jgi:hypothetical protein
MAADKGQEQVEPQIIAERSRTDSAGVTIPGEEEAPIIEMTPQKMASLTPMSTSSLRVGPDRSKVNVAALYINQFQVSSNPRGQLRFDAANHLLLGSADATEMRNFSSC